MEPTDAAPRTQGPATRLVIVANRLPVRWSDEGEEGGRWIPSPGGLVSAVGPAIAQRPGDAAWIGWTGAATEEEPFEVDGLHLHPVAMSDDEKVLFYDGMSNGTLWPLYHDKVVPSEFHRHWFDGYKRVNRRYAEAAAAAAGPEATVWVHDYQLQLVPGMLRELRPDLRIGFFLHIPFPPPEVFQALPWREQLAQGMLGADLNGFQTPEAAANFRRLTMRLGLAEAHGDESVVAGDRVVRACAYPIGIDVARYEGAAHDRETTERARDLRARLGAPHTVLLGVDRLDYTKGIDVRLRALKELLDEGSLNPATVTMVQIAQPSRDDVEAYITLREEVERLVGQINGDHSRVGFPILHYIHQDVEFEELMAMYRAADVMLVTPFRDGMNLVAKEYVAARYDLTGSLVLSEFAGAATELADALLVNPYDVDGLKAAIVRAVSMPPAEARERMERMRAAVEANDASEWADRFLRDLAADRERVTT
ncbi:alpha,alpha-trehalose-phosphate synthase (UDP-forming) [Actinomarinicola tropica]|uniref:Trehalose-6-phosphate synthase n=1 Tax=Actinomarinicola tropica TaxID=2789776 RepID=A0A5Q2RND9_9ACTN|nr:trehalose-6-phosphate synthase [Actinomarinicola tropica]QGG95410.1 trehalose-6-phosphate synthase [Actinomarinicola tropica]